MPFGVIPPGAYGSSKYRHCKKCEVRWGVDEPMCFVCGKRGTLGPAYTGTYMTNPMTITQRSYESED